MLRYLYIPENEDLDEHIEYAINNNFNQIIHGYSDIIKDYISNKNFKQEINIPEYQQIINNNLVFRENEEFTIMIIDEFNLNNDYEISHINIYKIDESQINKKNLISSNTIKNNNNYMYEYTGKLDSYGEYPFDIIIKLNNKMEKKIFSEKIIIYKEYKEKEEIDDKFFFYK